MWCFFKSKFFIQNSSPDLSYMSNKSTFWQTGRPNKSTWNRREHLGSFYEQGCIELNASDDRGIDVVREKIKVGGDVVVARYRQETRWQRQNLKKLNLCIKYIKSTNLRIFCWRRALIIILAWLLMYWAKNGIIWANPSPGSRALRSRRCHFPKENWRPGKQKTTKNNEKQRKRLLGLAISVVPFRSSSWMRLIAWPRPHNRQGTLVKIESISFFLTERLNQLRRDMQKYVDMMYVCGM